MTNIYVLYFSRGWSIALVFLENRFCLKKDINSPWLGEFSGILLSFESSGKPSTVTVTFKLKYLWLVVGIAMLLLAVSPIVYLYTSTSAGGGATPAPPPSAQVNCSNPCQITIENSQFGNGQPVVIKAGTVVTWVNKDDTTHTATSNSGVWDTGIIAPGTSSKPVTFSTPGTFPYFCQVHPMSGEIVVVS